MRRGGGGGAHVSLPATRGKSTTMLSSENSKPNVTFSGTAKRLTQAVLLDDTLMHLVQRISLSSKGRDVLSAAAAATRAASTMRAASFILRDGPAVYRNQPVLFQTVPTTTIASTNTPQPPPPPPTDPLCHRPRSLPRDNMTGEEMFRTNSML